MLLLLTQIIPSLVNVDPIADKIGKQVQDLTGEPFVRGEATISLLRGGKLIFEGVAIRNPPGMTTNYFMKAQQLVVNISLLDLLFKEAPKPESIEVIAPQFELERIDADRNNWSFLHRPRDESAAPDDMTIHIVDAEVIYTDQQAGVVHKLTALGGEMNITLGQLAMNLAGRYDDVPSQLSGACQFQKFQHLGMFDTDCALSVTQESSRLDISGRLIAQNGAFTTRGTVGLEATDARFWGDVFFSGVDKKFSDYYANPLPVSLKAEAYFDSTRSVVNVSEFKVGKSSGKASVSITSGDTGNQGNTTVWFDLLDYDELISGIKQTVGGEQDLFAGTDAFNEALASNITMQAAKVRMFHGIELSNLTATGQLAGGSITITDMRAALPGTGSITTFGRVAPSEDGLSYEGQVEASGNSLDALMPMLGAEVKQVPEGIFTQFRTRFNLIVRPRSVTLSELRMIAGNNIRIVGGVNMFYDNQPKMNASLAIQNLDLTPFEAAWLGGASLLTPPDQLTTYNPFAFSWLNNLETNVNLDLDLDDFVMMGLPGKASTVMVHAKKGSLVFDRINFNLGGSRVDGSLSIAQAPTQPRPVMEAKLNISRLNLADALRDLIWAKEERSPQDSVWSREPINFSPLHFFDGTAELRIRQLDHHDFHATGFRGLFQLADNQLTISQVKMFIWGGEMQLDAKVDSEVVPGITLSLSMLNGQVRDFFQSFAKFDQLAGLLSLQSNIRFSGVNFESWIDNISGHVTLDARNVFVQDFNLPAIVRSIESVRAVSGLLNAVRMSLGGGSTRLGNVNGTFYLSKGTMQTTRVTFRSNESVGELEGAVNLRKWTMDMVAKFGLVTLAQTGYPVLAVTLRGPAEMPERGLNTKSIEAFLAQRLR